MSQVITGIGGADVGDVGGDDLHVLALGLHAGDRNVNGAE